MNIPDEAVEAAINARGRANNPKWDHPLLGYETFSVEQKGFLREQARIMLEAAAPHLIAPIELTTEEELDALPVGAVVRGKWLAEKWADEEGDLWYVAGKGMRWETGDLVRRGGLPATVIHEPRSAGAGE